MKFILFDVEEDTSSKFCRIVEHHLNENITISEIKVSSKNIKDRLKAKDSFFSRLSTKLMEKTFMRCIKKALNKHDKKWYYVLSANIKKDSELTKYIELICEKLLGYNYITPNEMNTNIFKYIDEYINNIGINEHDTRMLLVFSKIKSINMNLIVNLIKKYRSVNIYLNEPVTGYILKQIEKINSIEGSTIEIVKKGKKAFTEYNVIYFADDYKVNYPRFRYGKDSYIIDSSDSKQDKYNTNLTFLNEYVEQNYIDEQELNSLKAMYNSITLASLINKIINNH